jgi:hypothetical protein
VSPGRAWDKDRFFTALHRHRWVVVLFVAALVLRLHWNLVAHPLGEFMYSDMNGYNKRANAVIDAPFGRSEYIAFFPFGTPWLIATLKLLFGRDNFTAIAIAYAIFGAIVVANTYLIAHRVADRKWVAPAVGVLMVIYYPLISLGGYMLSEPPFTVCLTTCVLLTLRLLDGGRDSTALALGTALGIGVAIRPQLLLSAGVFGLYWLWRRPSMPNIGWRQLIRVGIPLATVLAIGSARFYWHTGRFGLISENGPINQVFGRCHNKGMYSRPDGEGHGTIRFAPPPLIQLEAYSALKPDRLIQLAPVFGDDPTPVESIPGFALDAYGCTKRTCRLPGGEVQYKGYIGDRKIHRALALECMRRSGVARQLYFSFTHVVQLWAFNQMWPDQADPKPRPKRRMDSWRALSEGWRRLHNAVFAVPALLGLIVLRRPDRPERAIVALNLFALVMIAALYIGGVRFRIPYDPIIIVLAALTYEAIAIRVARRFSTNKL